MNKRLTLIAGALGLTAAGLGAFGAHALRTQLTVNGTLETWRTAVFYHFLHTIAILAIAQKHTVSGKAAKAAYAWLLGVVCFSGSLYGLALGGPRILGPITPVGGLFFLIGWSLILVDGFARETPKSSPL